jgi:protein-tyrosine phosphatase
VRHSLSVALLRVLRILRASCFAALAVACSSEPGDDAGLAGTRAPAKPRLAEPEPEPEQPPAMEQPEPEPEAPSSTCQRSQFVLRPDISNARDLGGVPLAEGTVACGAIFRGPPLRLTEQGCEQLAELEIQTVLDLRTDSERLSAPEAPCVTANLLAAPLPIPYGLGPEDYLRDLNTDESVAKVFHTLGDERAYPVYFHCTYGRDRTGVIGALLLLTLGASRQTIMEEYMLSEPNVGAYPHALEAVLDEVERRGGAHQLLRELGITDEELAVLKRRAVAP